MSCPDFQSYTLPILKSAALGEELTLSQLRERAALALGLTDADLAETVESGRQTRHKSRAGWACTYLRQAGLLESTRRGVYRITGRGRKVLLDPPKRIDLAFLSEYPEFLQFTSRSAASAADETPDEGSEASLDVDETPEERIAEAYRSLRGSVENELLTRILSGTPAFFEDLVVKLLVKMGYGGSLADAGKAIGQSGDDGLDGVIKEDRLGLDAIYLQAKRWRPDRRVGRPDVQAFAGSLEGVRARKGVFLTTSSFSNEAQEYVSRIEKKIVLIDGSKLTGLMFDFGVGLRTKETYEVKEIDEDYFVDD